MHDPMTLALSIKSIWKRKSAFFKEGYRSSWVDIWHVDPEMDGSDDSCGYSFVKQTKAQSEAIEKEGRFEWGFLYGRHGKKREALEVIWAAWVKVAWKNDRRRSLTVKEINYIFSLAFNPVDNFQHLAKELNETVFDHESAEKATRAQMGVDEDEYLPEEKVLYVAREKELIKNGQEQCARLFFLINRCYLTMHRPWWKKPKWHVHHWEIHIPIVRALRRWLFDRCCKCGKGFAWGYSPIGNWDGDKIWHHDCDQPAQNFNLAGSASK